MTLPNLLVIGAAKSGTTALYHYLNQHPQVYMSPNKEPNFFAFEGQQVAFRGPGDRKMVESTITTLEAYGEEFAAVSNEIAVGEASPWYLYSPQAPQNIKRHIPEVKLIAMLRNPVDRAYSSYLHVLRDARETLTFEEGLLAEEERIERGWEFIWHYKQAGFYAAQVERILTLFSKDQVRFYLYDDLLADPEKLLKDVYTFLCVDTGFVVNNTSQKFNATGVPKNRLLGRLLLQPNPVRSVAKYVTPERMRSSINHSLYQRLLSKPVLSEETRKRLSSAYEQDILILQDLLDRDLSTWTNS